VIRFRLAFRRTAAIPAVLGATLALATFTYPGGLACAYDDLRNLEEYEAQMANGKIVSNRHDATLVNLADRLALKDRILADLIDGRTDLSEATRRFMELNATNDVARNAVEDSFAGDTYEEKSARNVIEFVRNRLLGGPAPSNTPPAHRRAIPRDVRQGHLYKMIPQTKFTLHCKVNC